MITELFLELFLTVCFDWLACISIKPTIPENVVADILLLDWKTLIQAAGWLESAGIFRCVVIYNVF